MSISDHEKEYVAQRAAGYYPLKPTIQRIVDKHGDSTDPDDQVFLEFSRLTLQENIPYDKYMRLAHAVLELVPKPFGHPWDKQPPKGPIPGPYPDSKPPKKKRKKKGARKCGICSETGHNARTCPDKPDTSTVFHDDGIERLTPGFDPNPPVAD